MTITIDVIPNGSGEVEVDGVAIPWYPFGQPVERGAVVRLEAIPQVGYRFAEWDGEPIENDNPVELGMVIRNMRITAHFVPDTIEFASEDEVLSVIVPEGTTALDNEGEPLAFVEFNEADTPLLPEQTEVIGLAYELEPRGATFDPSVTILWKYDPADIPSGVAEENLVIAYNDGVEWIELASDVDAEDDTVTTEVDHFTIFALIAHIALPPPMTTAFTTSSLDILPTEVSVGEPVTISVLVTNTGQESGSGIVALRVDEVETESWEITLDAGNSEMVTFTISQERVGPHFVEVNGLSGSFSVTEGTSPLPPPENQEPPLPPPASTPPVAHSRVNWAIVGPIVVAVFLAIFIPIRLRSRRGPLDW